MAIVLTAGVGSTPDLFADLAPEAYAGAPAALFDRPAPRWFTIAAHRPFLDDLAAGLYAALAQQGPEALSDAVVLTPTRRGARALAEAFVGAAGGAATLLPQIRAVGDLDEGEPPFEGGEAAIDLAPAVSPLRRRFELARLAVAHQDLLERRLDAAAALEMADALATFLDGVEIEEVADPAQIETLVEGLVQGELARHWRISAEFLRIATREWPARLQALGLVDVGARRVALLRVLAEQWRARPTAHALIAAGSTGTAPTAADLLAVVAAAPRGAVVLPGLDLDLEERAWAKVGEAHPQGAMKRLLARARVGREAVMRWPAPETAAEATRGRSRRRVVNAALRPAEATDDWLALIHDLQAEGAKSGIDVFAEGLSGLSVLTAATDEDVAAQAALLLREALETPGKTAALVTPDAALARRVSARLSRWGVEADSSAGAPLASFPAGVLLTLTAQAAAEPLHPSTLLALAKHPLSQLGLSAATVDLARRRFERHALRGPRPRDWDEIHAALTAEPDAAAVARALQGALAIAQAPFAAGDATAPEAARALALALEALATDADGRLGKLWAGAGGEACAALVAGLIADGAGLPPCTPCGFAEVVRALATEETVRTGGAAHPRLRILGAIEGRLVRADRLVLAGLEEGSWPRPAPIDPFLSRPMRERIGLPPPERRIGLSAHDFAQAACAPEVFMIHAQRRDGAPAVKSRWLWRLETLARGAQLALPGRPEIAAWARALDAPLIPPPPELRPAERPRPTPPVAARPRTMAVTRIETWVRDPYAAYARAVLRLKRMSAPDEPVESRARGSAVHRAFEALAEQDAAHADAPEWFRARLLQELAAAGLPAWRMAREGALAARAGIWAAAFEAERRAGAALLVERTGTLTFDAPGGPFTITAKADRLEARAERTDVLDFKTGGLPTKRMVESGLSPQLTLTAAILAAGGFEEVTSAEPGELLYVRVTGRTSQPAPCVIATPGESGALAQAALAGLQRFVARFDQAATPYLAWAAPQLLSRYTGDYDHLARVWEWRVMGADGDADGAGDGGGEA